MFNKKKKDEEIIVKSKPTDEEINATEILNDETSESLPETEQVEEKKEKKKKINKLKK